MAHSEAGAQFGLMVPRSSHGQRQARGGSASTSSKLRDSCHACATSKVRCPKEKPSCSRCKTRSIPCQYFFTKRPGRRRDSTVSSGAGAGAAADNSPNNTHADADTDGSRCSDGDTINTVDPRSIEARLLPEDKAAPTSGRTGADGYLSPSLSIPTSPGIDKLFATDSSDMLSVLGEAAIFPGLADLRSDVNNMDMDMDMEMNMDFVMSPFGLPLLDTTMDITQTTRGGDTASLLFSAQSNNNPELGSPETGATFESPSTSSDPSSLASNAHALSLRRPGAGRVLDTPSSTCGCLTQALDLLKTLSSPPCPRNSGSAAESPNFVSASTSATATGSLAQTVVSENKQSIDAVNSMIMCPSCAEDTFLLTVSSMIVLKILERYAATTRAPLTQQGGPRPGDEAGKDRDLAVESILLGKKDRITEPSRAAKWTAPHVVEGRIRTSAQLVLGELHRVQRLVNQLAPKLKGVRDERRRKTAGEFDKMSTVPFSARTLDQVESDVRKSLGTLSAEIINVLRHLQ